MALIDNTDITKEQIAKKGLDSLPSKYQKTIGFFAWDYLLAIGYVLIDLWQKVIYICKCLTDLSNMTDEDLENFVRETTGIERNVSTKANGELTVLNGQGTITAGEIFTTDNGVQYQATETKTVSINDTFMVECMSSGAVGNCESNKIVNIPATIQGIVAVTNVKPFTNGYSEEDKEHLLNRYYEHIRHPIVSGNKYHYKYWAEQVSGVGGAIVKPLWNGANTVKVVIIGENNGIATDELVNEVQEYIDPKGENNSTWGCGIGQAPIGAFCTVEKAITKRFKIAGVIDLENGYSITDVKNGFSEALKSYQRELSQKIMDTESSVTISQAKIMSILLSVEGVLDVDSITISVMVGNISHPSDNIIVCNNEYTQIGKFEVGEITLRG